VSYTASNGCPGTSAPFAVTIVPCAPHIMFDSYGSFLPITGDGDGNLERGEKWSIQVTLINDGNLDATRVLATLGGNDITVCSSPTDFGNIGFGKTASATIEFVISATFSPCGNPIQFGITAKSCNELSPAGPDEPNAFSATVGQQVPGSATDLVIQPSAADAWVDEQNPTTTNGTGTTTDVRRRVNRNHRTLIQFSLAGIPAGSTINSATLELNATAAPTTGQQLDVHHITGTWTETGVTWNTLPTYAGTADTSIAGGTTTGWKIWTVGPIVQAWTSGTYANYGFLVKCNLETTTTSYLYQFATRENATTGNRPILRVNYTPPPSWDCTFTGGGTCASAGPKPVPDGRLGGTAMKGTRVTANGSTITVVYDTATCSAQTDHSILYGNLASVASLIPTGGECSIGNTSPYTNWTTVPTGYNVWWVIVGDGGTTESSWGQKYIGGAYSERSAAASGQCGNTAIDTAGTCP